MTYSCKILLDSISETNKRLTTFEITFPRIVLAEFNTHRMFSRNSASSRAIPFNKQLERVGSSPFIPEAFPLNSKGMQPIEYITKENDSKVYDYLVVRWLKARDRALSEAELLYNAVGDVAPFSDLNNKYLNDNNFYKNIHKQIVNRLLEAYHLNDGTNFPIDYKDGGTKKTKTGETIIVSNMQRLKVGEWHCPLVSEEDNLLIENYLFATQHVGIDDFNHLDILENRIIEIKKKISVARCARVSYLTHDGKRDIEKDLELFERLKGSGHWSPFEHVATPYFGSSKMQNYRSGNFVGWKQYRKEFQDENCTSFRKEN